MSIEYATKRMEINLTEFSLGHCGRVEDVESFQDSNESILLLNRRFSLASCENACVFHCAKYFRRFSQSI